MAEYIYQEYVDSSGKLQNVLSGELVRCADCADYQTDWKPSYPGVHYCATMDSMMRPNDFCSYGERREGESDGKTKVD